MMKLVSVAEMRSIEEHANQLGLNYEEMMNRAGQGLSSWIQKTYGFLEEKVVLGLVGSGNNGGDCLVALTDLQQNGWQCTAYIVRPREPGDPLLKVFMNADGKILDGARDKKGANLDQSLSESKILVDGVLGTGIKLPLKSEVASVMDHVRERLEASAEGIFVVAVDCPSGVDCDSGAAAPETIPADWTVCMAAVKDGLLKLPAFSLAGELVTVDIGLPDDLPEWAEIKREVADETMVRAFLPKRTPDSHKGTFGTALIVAGSINYMGAAILAASAAYRIGTGLVTLCVPEPLQRALASRLPEATWLILPQEMGVIASDAVEVLQKNLDKVSAMLLGSGWGLEDTTLNFLERFLRGKTPDQKPSIGFIRVSQASKETNGYTLPPLVIDADGLKLLAKIDRWWELVPERSILTPHPGEMSILTKIPVSEIQADRQNIAVKFAQEWNQVVVLKGAFTIIADPSGRSATIPVATSALAKAGTGDVLAGMITGLRAQRVEPFSAAVAGAWMHGQCGLVAADRLGTEASVLAGDVVAAIQDVLATLNE